MTLNYAIESGNPSLSGNNSELRISDAAAPTSPRGHSAVFEEIWRAHAKQILRITRSITKNQEDAEDALQDSFLRAYVHLHTFDGRSSFKTWLTRIAINSALMILRKRRSAVQVSVDDSDDSETYSQAVTVADGRPSPEARYAQLEQQAMLRGGIRTLRPAIRRALELQVLGDRSVQEAAEEMGLSISATKARIFHAKAALRKSLDSKTHRRSRASGNFQLATA